MKNPMTPSGNRTRDFPICTVVPQPTASRIPTSESTNVKVQKVYMGSNIARDIHCKHRIAAIVCHTKVVCSRYIVVNNDGTSNKVSNMIRSHTDNSKLLLICILLLSHSLIFLKVRFFINIWLYSCLVL